MAPFHFLGRSCSPWRRSTSSTTFTLLPSTTPTLTRAPWSCWSGSTLPERRPLLSTSWNRTFRESESVRSQPLIGSLINIRKMLKILQRQYFSFLHLSYATLQFVSKLHFCHAQWWDLCVLYCKRYILPCVLMGFVLQKYISFLSEKHEFPRIHFLRRIWNPILFYCPFCRHLQL